MPAFPRDEASRVADSDTMSADERTLCEHLSDDEGYAERRSTELSDADHDHDILESEDERERLLTQQEGISGLFSKKGVKIGKRDRTTQPHTPNRSTKSRQRKGRQHEETSALMYEMEEGIGTSHSTSSRRSSESDEQRLLATSTQIKACITVPFLPCCRSLIESTDTTNTLVATYLHLPGYRWSIPCPPVRGISGIFACTPKSHGFYGLERNLTFCT